MFCKRKVDLALSHCQNSLINISPIQIECFQPIDRRQVETGIGEGHQLPVDQIPVAFRSGHGILGQLYDVLCSGIGQRIGVTGGQYAALQDFQGRNNGL